MKIIDLSQPLTNDTPHYPGDNPFKLHEAQFKDITISSMSTSMHVGTHLDLPRHMLKDNRTVKDIPLMAFIGKARVIDVRNPYQNGIFDDVLENDIILIRTDYSKDFSKPGYYDNFPVLKDHWVDTLLSKKIKLLGLDTPSPDKAPYPLHKKLFNQDIFIIENLTNLDQLPLNKPFMFYGVPLNVAAEGSLIRAFAILDKIT